MRVRRFADNPIITPALSPRLGDNINGPSLIRVPAWVAKPHGRYYLYFAHHEGDHLRLAYADDLAGPWRIYEPGVLSLAEAGFDDHVASPEVQVVPERQEIRLYYHGCFRPDSPDRPAQGFGQAVWGAARTDYSDQQFQRLATSTDGLRFTVQSELLGPPYWRLFHWRDWWYALAMPGRFFRSRDGVSNFVAGPQLFTHQQRHSALRLVADTLHVFYTNAGDAPERILRAQISLTDDWQDWRAGEPELTLEPATVWEGADLPIEPSQRGAVYGRVRQLRDPAIFEEAGRVYLLYAVAGESGVAIAEIEE